LDLFWRRTKQKDMRIWTRAGFSLGYYQDFEKAVIFRAKMPEGEPLQNPPSLLRHTTSQHQKTTCYSSRSFSKMLANYGMCKKREEDEDGSCIVHIPVIGDDHLIMDFQRQKRLMPDPLSSF
jgi:hypothetical protein